MKKPLGWKAFPHLCIHEVFLEGEPARDEWGWTCSLTLSHTGHTQQTSTQHKADVLAGGFPTFAALLTLFWAVNFQCKSEHTFGKMLSFHAFKGTFSSINLLMPTELRDVAKGSLILLHSSGFFFWGGGEGGGGAAPFGLRGS